jgi:hypothetical protein
VALLIVHHAANHALQVSDFQVQISEVHLSPRLTEAASGIAKNRIAIVEQLGSDIP